MKTPSEKLLTLADCPVECLQTESELQLLLSFIKLRDPKKLLEIGTFFGGTLWFFNQVADFESITVVDLPIPKYDDRYEQMIASRAKWSEWIKPGCAFHDFQGSSHDSGMIDRVKTLHAERDIDLLHIDGDHSYEGVKADYYNFKDLVRPGGMIVFHDVIGIPDVARLWVEVQAELNADATSKSCIYTIKSGSKDNPGWGIGVIITPD